MLALALTGLNVMVLLMLGTVLAGGIGIRTQFLPRHIDGGGVDRLKGLLTASCQGQGQ